MKSKVNGNEKIYKAAQKAVSIALYEMGEINESFMRTSYSVSVPQYFATISIPVLSKYMRNDMIAACIKSAQEIALARMIRGWSWWEGVAIVVASPFLFINFLSFLIVFLIFTFINSIVFRSRKIVGKIWDERGTSKESDAIALEQMIEMCKKGSFRICLSTLIKNN